MMIQFEANNMSANVKDVDSSLMASEIEKNLADKNVEVFTGKSYVSFKILGSKFKIDFPMFETTLTMSGFPLLIATKEVNDDNFEVEFAKLASKYALKYLPK